MILVCFVGEMWFSLDLFRRMKSADIIMLILGSGSRSLKHQKISNLHIWKKIHGTCVWKKFHFETVENAIFC